MMKISKLDEITTIDFCAGAQIIYFCVARGFVKIFYLDWVKDLM